MLIFAKLRSFYSKFCFICVTFCSVCTKICSICGTKLFLKFSQIPAICSGADVTGRTIKTICEINDKFIPCNQQHIVGTIAHITCGSFYQMPNLTENSYLSQKLTCLSTGSWDKIALRCVPKCGRITQAATAYIVGGKKAKNVAEVRKNVGIFYKIKTVKFSQDSMGCCNL